MQPKGNSPVLQVKLNDQGSLNFRRSYPDLSENWRPVDGARVGVGSREIVRICPTGLEWQFKYIEGYRKVDT